MKARVVVGVVTAAAIAALAAQRPVEAQIVKPPTVCNPATHKVCGTACVPQTVQNGCGVQGCSTPCAIVGAAPTCEAGTRETTCGYATCNPGMVDADGRRSNGCEAWAVRAVNVRF